jgi:hypothetical protein
VKAELRKIMMNIQIYFADNPGKEVDSETLKKMGFTMNRNGFFTKQHEGMDITIIKCKRDYVEISGTHTLGLERHIARSPAGERKDMIESLPLSK